MAIAVNCRCGRGFQVSVNQAGKKVECPKCGVFVRVPSDGPTDAPMDWGDQDDGAAAPADWRQYLPSTKREPGRCQSCDEPAKRKYPFFGAEMGGVGEIERTGSGSRFKVTYKNVTRHTLTLCEDCALAAYRGAVWPYAVAWGVLAVLLPLITLAFWLNVLPAETRAPGVLVAVLLGGVFLCLLGVSVWGMLRPDLKGETMSRAVVAIARRDRPDLGPHFFTPQDVKRMGGHEGD